MNGYNTDTLANFSAFNKGMSTSRPLQLAACARECQERISMISIWCSIAMVLVISISAHAAWTQVMIVCDPGGYAVAIVKDTDGHTSYHYCKTKPIAGSSISAVNRWLTVRIWILPNVSAFNSFNVKNPSRPHDCRTTFRAEAGGAAACETRDGSATIEVLRR